MTRLSPTTMQRLAAFPGKTVDERIAAALDALQTRGAPDSEAVRRGWLAGLDTASLVIETTLAGEDGLRLLRTIAHIRDGRVVLGAALFGEPPPAQGGGS